MSFIPSFRDSARLVWMALVTGGWAVTPLTDVVAQDASLPAAIEKLSPHVFSPEKRQQLRSMVRDDLRRRLQAANDRSSKLWNSLSGLEAWEKFRGQRIAALRNSLGRLPRPKNKPKVFVTRKLAGDGYRIENLVFTSEPGWVAANLYLPEKPAEAMPGILICHSHHRPKTHRELQDMGMTWARAGCAVLVMDQFGHGERSGHPFRSADDYDKPFRVSRQDYYFRYDSSLQLYLLGESLAGWMARDLMRGVDLLLARGDVDPKRIILLGSVAGGGDPAAVAGVLDERIAAVVPFNFGGPQPETRFPLPEDAETSFNYAGGGSWESTRNLRLSARDGFLPWVIVGGVAPRRLIFGHEFNWDRPRDPVWKRLRQIYAWHESRDLLAYTHGRGELRGRPPQATHCTHIGRPHRVMIHAALKRWFKINVDPANDEYSKPRESAELMCMTPKVQREIQAKPHSQLFSELSRELLNDVRITRASLSPEKRQPQMREVLARLLGNIEPNPRPKVTDKTNEMLPGKVSVHRLALEVEPGVSVPLLLLEPDGKNGGPVVVAVAQGGKEAFLRQRGKEIAALLSKDIAVCLPDVRGTGETRPGDGRGRYSADTSRNATELMLGGTMVGARLRDLRTVLQYLRGRTKGDSQSIALWGDSFAAANPEGTNFKVPRRVDGRPKDSEPLGGVLALLAGLFEPQVRAVYVHRGLTSLESVLSDFVVHVPHDAVVPGWLAMGDLDDVAAGLAPRPLRLEALVDGLNRPAKKAGYSLTQQAYDEAKAGKAFTVTEKQSSPAAWLAVQLQTRRASE